MLADGSFPRLVQENGGGESGSGWSSVEVFADDGQAVLSDQIFPDPSSQGVSAFAQGGTASLVSFSATQLNSAWP